jgi:transcriptional regulator with GAF, ATPase, and Fis domain
VAARVGGERIIRVSVRVISAANRDLPAMTTSARAITFKPKKLNETVFPMLESYGWPGNARSYAK